MDTPDYWINHLQLQSHPEGGYFRQMYQSDETLTAKTLPERYAGERTCSTSIYFLLTETGFSAFHRLQSDEVWHFYTGDPVEIYVIGETGEMQTLLLGPDPSKGQHFQLTVPHNHWFAARVEKAEGFALVGCTVAPGFHFEDFELAERDKLVEQYPRHVALIGKLTRI